MSSSTHAILCGTCHRQVETVADPEPDDQVTCSGCGQSDRFDNVMSAVQEHVGYLTQKLMTEHLSKATRGSSILKFKPQHIPNPGFRWMIEGGL